MKIALMAATAVAAISLAGTAAAQDWSGFYVGAHAGYAWGDAEMPYGGVGGPFVFTQDDANIDGALFGGQLGYNWQHGGWVFGVEGDIEWTDMSGDDGGSGGDVNGVDINWQGSIRGRVGHTLGSGDTLLYGTVGWVMQDVDASAPAQDVNQSIDGIVYGVGLEHRFSSNWSASVEYRHEDMDQERFSFPIDGYDEGIETDNDSVRVAFNYHFP